MSAIAIVGLVMEIVSEAGKLGVDAFAASQEQLEEAHARFTAALDILKGARKTAESNIDMRHADAHRILDEAAAHPETTPAVAALIASAKAQFLGT